MTTLNSSWTCYRTLFVTKREIAKSAWKNECGQKQASKERAKGRPATKSNSFCKPHGLDRKKRNKFCFEYQVSLEAEKKCTLLCSPPSIKTSQILVVTLKLFHLTNGKRLTNLRYAGVYLSFWKQLNGLNRCAKGAQNSLPSQSLLRSR